MSPARFTLWATKVYFKKKELGNRILAVMGDTKFIRNYFVQWVSGAVSPGNKEN